MDKEALRGFIEKELISTDCYLVDLQISKDNQIAVEIDSEFGAVDIDLCISINKAIENEFEGEIDDYDLEVGSAGLTTPFKDRRQYKKHIGDDVEVLACDGKKYKGELRDSADESFTIAVVEKVKKEGSKRPVMEEVLHRFRYDEVKYTKYLLQF